MSYGEIFWNLSKTSSATKYALHEHPVPIYNIRTEYYHAAYFRGVHASPAPLLQSRRMSKGAVYIIVYDIDLVCCWVPQESQQWIYIGLTFSETMYIYCWVIYGTDNGVYIYATVGSLKSPSNGYIYIRHWWVICIYLLLLLVFEAV